MVLLHVVVIAGAMSAAPATPTDRLYSEEATATSYLQNNWNRFSENYHPSYILDDNPKTAWVEGVDGNGEGQSVSFHISPLTKVSAVRLRIRNGYQKSKKLFKANAAIRKLRIDLSTRTGRVVHSSEHALARRWGWQEVLLGLAERPGFSEVRLTIVATYAGSVYKDTCLSDVQLYVTAGVDYSAEVEKRKADTLATWIAGRRADAAYFAKLPKTYPFASTHFSLTSAKPRAEWAARSVNDRNAARGGAPPMTVLVEQGKLAVRAREHVNADDMAALSAFQKEIEVGGKTGRAPYRLVFNDRVAPPDGLDLPWMKGRWGLVNRDNFSLFESAKRVTHETLGEEDYVYGKVRRSVALVRWRDDAKKTPESVFLYRRERVEERTVYETDQYRLYVFDAAGNLSYAMYHGATNDDGFEGSYSRVYELLRFSRDAAGRVTTVARAEVGYDDSPEWDEAIDDMKFEAVNFAESGVLDANVSVAAAR
jgi:hypothetical protein